MKKLYLFINDHDLRIKNKCGTSTCHKNNVNSIIDCVINDDHNDWKDVYKLKIYINDIKFYCKKNKYSDHKPINLAKFSSKIYIQILWIISMNYMEIKNL